MRATFIFFFLLNFFWGFGQSISSEKGYSSSQYISPKTYRGLSQNFDVVEDHRGILYFGNNGGVLEFDGVTFRLIETELKSRVRALLRSKENRIFYGGQEEFGYFSADSLGNISANSISSKLPDTLSFGEIWNVLEKGEEIFFQSDFILFVFENEKLTLTEFENPISGSFIANENLYVNIEEQGLLRLMEGRFVPIPFSEKFKNDAITGIEKFNDSHLIVATAQSGFFLVEINPYGNELSVNEFQINFKEVINNTTIQSFKKIAQGQFAFGTNGDGVFVFDQKGSLTQTINETSGIKDPFVNELLKDSRGELRLALGNGMAFVKAFEPISTFNSENGLEGIVEDIARFKGKLYCATHEGVYRLNTSFKNQPIFELVSDLQCWDLLPITIDGKEILLGAFNDGVYEIAESGELNQIAENYPWKLHQSEFDTTLIFVGLDPGLGFIKYKDKRWVVGNEDYDFDAIYNFSETGKTLWAGTFRDGLVYGIQNIQIQGDSLLTYQLIEIIDSAKQLPQSSVFSCVFNRQPIFGVDSAIFIYDKDFGGFKSFEPQQRSLKGKRYYHRLLNQKDEKLWAITVLPNEEFEFGFFDATNNFKWVSNPFKIMTDGIIHSIYVDSGGEAWLGGTEGLYRYDPKIEKDFSRPFKTHIRRVEVNRTTTIFGGAFYVDTIGIVDFQPTHQIPELTYEENNLLFEFAAFAESDPEKHKYQYRLKGLEEEWSPKNSEPKAVYTNLEPGEYTFEVKSTNIYGVESNVATYQFSISPPWYQTPWYYAGQFGFIGLLVFFTIYLNRSKRDSEYTAIVTFIGLITVFEFFLFLLEPYVEDWFGGVPIFQLLANIILAISLNPVEYWVRGVLKNKKQENHETEDINS